jgi:prepilin-type N-terminal cleavage/methylation domain-containing protein
MNNIFKLKKNKINSKNQRGFTLVEMIISLAIFTVVAVVAIGALLKITDANRKSITLKTTINNLNFALESMSREMRVGSDYSCNGCNGGGTGSWILTFRSTQGCYFEYSYTGYSGGTNGTLQKAEEAPCGDGEFHDLISPNINITNFIVNLDTTYQPKVFLFLKGYSKFKEKDKTEFALQTTISQRLSE